ncbi:hypothetical protein GCM10007063_10450 [Lentibacillus kapialis]|uniref:DUF1189 domain-containing protein n=1 Tax=Lentibacillus kapialis TaxID=340214 RepID=A0A917PSP5_9BACI|nr:hypothetical protein [Lentibacillus kapialis]GGJ89701.1 hypothetical protein GCM10007063_10450 [Lentibacillus kapialis]
MKFWIAFINSIKLPNRQAIFALNRISMDIAVLYLFILLLIVSAPSLADQLTDPGTGMHWLLLLIYFFIFYYLPLNMVVLLLVSLMAYIGAGIAKLLKRKIRFSILWKLVVYMTTIPFLLYTIIALFFPIGDVLTGLFILYTFIFMIKVIIAFPKRKRRK